MKERCRDGCRTSLLIAGVVLVPAIFHTLLPSCHPYITIHFMEMIFSTCIQRTTVLCDKVNEKSCRYRMATYRDGVRRKGDKFGMGV